MKIQYFKEYSDCLSRDMEYKIYGHSGKICLVISTQNNRFHEWEYRGMFDTVKEEIDRGRIRFVTCDSIDLETWSNDYGDPTYRFTTHENWVQYLVTELMPSVCEKLHDENPWWVIGASIGATHAANVFFRFPDRFDGVLGLSGIYDVDMYYASYHNEITYQNNPMAYLYNISPEHDYIKKYNRAQIIFCVGQGMWEEQTLVQTRQFEQILKAKGIQAWFDYWGYDVYHDWPWWRVQLPYFIRLMLEHQKNTFRLDDALLKKAD